MGARWYGMRHPPSSCEIHEMHLVLGNKAYSSWSLRPWLLLRIAGIPFEEIPLAIGTARFKEEIVHLSPNERVPALIDGELTIWDSLAIAEYLAERFPEKHLWPSETAARAHARSVSAEMHSGFAALREHMTMNVRRVFTKRPKHPAALADAARIIAIWEDCRSRYASAGPWLFGRFSIADAMFAPVVTRFRTYGVDLPEASRRYAEMVLAHPEMQRWYAFAALEPEIIDKYELVDA